jgi:hypothetical protein
LTIGFSVSLKPLLAVWVNPLYDPANCSSGGPGCEASINVDVQTSQIKTGPLYVNNDNLNSVGLAVVNGRAVINTLTPDASVQLQINADESKEGLRIVSASDYSPLNIRNNANTADIFRVDQSGSLATGTIPLARLSVDPAQCSSGEYMSGFGSEAACSVPIKSCPSEFLAVISQSRLLGCMQINSNSAKNCRDAMLDCFDTYGARLPEYQEAYIAFNNTSGLGAITTNEWVGSAFYDSDKRCSDIQSDLNLNRHIYDASLVYRCWIPVGSL